MSDDLRAVVESIGVFGHSVTVVFRGPAGEYSVSPDNARFMDVMTALIESWRLQRPVNVTFFGPTIVDARLT